MGKRRGRRIHCPSRLTAPKRKSTMHAVSILGIPTSGSNTTPITSVRECTQAGIGNIAQVTSVSQRTPVVIALSVIEGLPIVSTHHLAFQASPQVDTEALPHSTELSLKIPTLTTAYQMDSPCTTQPIISDSSSSSLSSDSSDTHSDTSSSSE